MAEDTTSTATEPVEGNATEPQGDGAKTEDWKAKYEDLLKQTRKHEDRAKANYAKAKAYDEAAKHAEEADGSSPSLTEEGREGRGRAGGDEGRARARAGRGGGRQEGKRASRRAQAHARRHRRGAGGGRKRPLRLRQVPPPLPGGPRRRGTSRSARHEGIHQRHQGPTRPHEGAPREREHLPLGRKTMPAPENQIAAADVVTALDVEFIENFTHDVNQLMEVLGIFGVETMNAGTALYQYKVTGSLNTNEVAEGDEVPLSKYTVAKTPIGELETKPYRKLTTRQAILKAGFEERRPPRLDDKMGKDMRADIVKAFFTFLGKGTEPP
ncbi:MAG: hypothetical protein ACLTSX_00885 [Collinsella sp.]